MAPAADLTARARAAIWPGVTRVTGPEPLTAAIGLRSALRTGALLSRAANAGCRLAMRVEIRVGSRSPPHIAPSLDPAQPGSPFLGLTSTTPRVSAELRLEGSRSGCRAPTFAPVSDRSGKRPPRSEGGSSRVRDVSEIGVRCSCEFQSNHR